MVLLLSPGITHMAALSLQGDQGPDSAGTAGSCFSLSTWCLALSLFRGHLPMASPAGYLDFYGSSGLARARKLSGLLQV